MTDREKAVRNVIRAWTKAGRRPDYHHAMQTTLHQKWPVLADAIEGLVAAERDSAPTIIRTVEELEALDTDTLVQPSLTEHREWPHVLSAASLRWELKAWGTDKGLPAVVIRDGAEVRAARNTLDKETNND